MSNVKSKIVATVFTIIFLALTSWAYGGSKETCAQGGCTDGCCQRADGSQCCTYDLFCTGCPCVY